MLARHRQDTSWAPVLVTSYEHAIIQKRTLGFYPKGLQEGSIPINPGPARLTIEGVCATLDDGQTTRLILFLDGQKITDFTDTTTDLARHRLDRRH